MSIVRQRIRGTVFPRTFCVPELQGIGGDGFTNDQLFGDAGCRACLVDGDDVAARSPGRHHGVVVRSSFAHSLARASPLGCSAVRYRAHR